MSADFRVYIRTCIRGSADEPYESRNSVHSVLEDSPGAALPPKDPPTSS